MKTLNSFFCGAGGFDVAFKQAGFEIAGAWDYDEYAVQSYRQNLGDHVKKVGVSDMTGAEIPPADVWTFGFPCQDLSLNGIKVGLTGGKRSILFFEIMRLLQEVEHKPSVIVAENVKGLAKYFDVLEAEYKKVGYRMYYKMYNTKFNGLPQNRERYYVVGIRDQLPNNFLMPEQDTEVKTRILDYLETDVDPSLYITTFDKTPILRIEGEEILVREAVVAGYRTARVGDTINIERPTSTTRRGRVGKGVAQTLLTVTGQLVVESLDRIRKLTPREYARLQGFPDSYEQVVSDAQFIKQMGNAVSVPVAFNVATSIKSFLDATDSPVE